MREGHGIDPTAVALERLQASTPYISNTGSYLYPFWLLFLEKTFDSTACWAEYKRRRICLKRTVLDCTLVIHDEPTSIFDKVT